MSIYLAIILASGLGWMLYDRSTRRARVQADPVVRIRGRGTYDFPIVGSSRYRSALERIYNRGAPDHLGQQVEALLLLEKGDHAVRVEVQGHTVGYLAPELATEFRRRLVDAGHLNAKAACGARITVRPGTPEYSDFSLRLDLPPKR